MFKICSIIYFQVIFSSYYEVLCNFTRDYDALRAKLAAVEERDKTILEAALHGVSALISEEWGQNTPCHVSEKDIHQITIVIIKNFFIYFLGYSNYRWQYQFKCSIPLSKTS